MALNKRKVLETARKHAQKGAKAKALKEYNRLLQADPRDAKLLLEVGDAYRRWGQGEEAIAQYSKVAAQYRQDGFDARAVAVFKQILNLDPKHYAAYVSLSELYQRMGLDSEAVSALQAAADGYHKEGRKPEALDLLRQMAALDPSNTTSRLKVAELLRQEGMEQEALAEYQAVAEELQNQQDRDQLITIQQRILEIEPSHLETLTSLVRNYMTESEFVQAEPIAVRAMEASPEPPQYELLIDLYAQMGNDAKLADATRSLAKLYRDRGDEDKARELMQRLPADDVAASSTSGRLAVDVSEVEEPSLGDDELLDEDPFLTLDEETDTPFPDAVPEAAPAAAVEESTESAPESLPEGDPDQLLAEASVYLRYGKGEQAIASLRSILVQDPSHRGALEKLGEAYADAGQNSEAVQHWMRAAEQVRAAGDAEALEVLRDRIAALDPVVAQEVGHIEGGGDADDSAPSLSATGLDITETETDVPDLDLDLDLEVDLDLDDAIDEVAEGETHSGLDFGSGASGPSDDFEIELDDESESLDASETDPMSAPATADVEETAPDLGDPVDEIEFELDDDITFSDEDDEDAEEAAESPTENHLETSGINPERVDEELEEAEFYIAQDMLDEAEGILKRVLEIAPNHPSALLRMGEIAAARGEIEGSGPSPTPELTLDDEGDDTLSAGGSATPPVTVDDEEEISFEVELDLDADDTDKAEEEDVAVEEPTESDLSAELEVTIEDEDEEFLDVSIEDEDLEIEPEPLAEEPPLAASASVQPPAEEASVDLDLDLDLDAESEDEATDPIAAAPEEIVSEDEADEPEPVVEEVPEEVAAAAPEPVLPDFADAGETFDLREALSDVLDDDEPLAADSNDTSGVLSTVEDGFASIFSDFKKGVSATLEEGDFDTRYDLGIAYREMGLFDDAIGEFRVCLDSPGRRFDSLYLMGLCARDLTRWDDAVHHLEQALALPEIPEERLAGVYFDLSIAQEGAGDLERACASVERVVELEADFPGAVGRLETLRSGGSALPEVGAPGEVYESFDELFDADDDEEGDERGDQALVESPPVETFESFDDVVSEAEAILVEPNGAEEEDVLAAEIIEEPETAEELHPGDSQSRKSGRKKISFV